MTKRNVIVSMIFVFLLLGPLLMVGSMRVAHIALPEWISPQGAEWLLGGHSSASVRASFNCKDIVSGELQNTIEDKIEDFVPCKKAALLAPAALQRCAIQSANSIFKWRACPTFYGSKYVFVSEQNALARMAFAPSDMQLEKLETFSRRLVSFAQAYPETEFCLILADQSDVSAANPTSQLVNGAWLSTDYAAAMTGWLEGAPNITVITEPYESAERYYHDYYRSDHHWNGYGALKICEKLAEIYHLPLSGVFKEYSTVLPGIAGIVENGSNARDGLMMVNESAQEPAFDLSGLTLDSGPAGLVLRGDVEELLFEKAAAEYNFYEVWYGYRGHSSFRSSVGSADNLLIVCDSFGTALKYPLACAFAHTDVLYGLHYYVQDMPSLAQSMADTQPAMVFFVGRWDNYAECLSRFPFYLDLGDEKGV